MMLLILEKKINLVNLEPNAGSDEQVRVEFSLEQMES